MKLELKEKYLIVLVALCFISIGFYYSYAIFVTKQLQENVVVVKFSNDRVTLRIDDNDNLVKISGNSSKNFKIRLDNIHDTDYYYVVLVKGLEIGVKVSSSDETKGEIKGKSSKEIMVHVNNMTKKEVELEFMVKIGNESYSLEEMNYHFINEIDGFDHSNANKPELDGLKLIPVNYQKISDTEGYWYKTDATNQTNVWYSYENGIWANAVLLNEANYKKYQNLSIGSKIEISDILGFYVWIPRFKYYIINSSNYTNYERMNNIVFEEEDNSTGTVECFDRISNLDDTHVFSEVCNDDYYDHIYDNLSTYTHPAFKNNNGFWVSKFLMGEGEKVIPNVSFLKKSIIDANEVSSKYTNTHVLTNMEYGAIVLLSNSSYGKTNNQMYSDENDVTFTRIYANTYQEEVTGCSSEYNIHSSSIITDESKKCITYNDLTDDTHVSNSISYKVGYRGAGASSTGTIYGVYDLANLNGEIVSAFIANDDGSIPLNINYCDVYSNNNYIGVVNGSSSVYNLYRYKLGDAIREHYRSFGEYGMWNNGTLVQNENNGIIVRGAKASVYSVSIEDENYVGPFRLVINGQKN